MSFSGRVPSKAPLSQGIRPPRHWLGGRAFFELLAHRSFEGGLTRPERVFLERHVRTCKYCRRLRGILSTVGVFLESLETVSAPEGFTECVVEKVRTGFSPFPERLSANGRSGAGTEKRAAWNGEARNALLVAAALCGGIVTLGLGFRRLIQFLREIQAVEKTGVRPTGVD